MNVNSEIVIPYLCLFYKGPQYRVFKASDSMPIMLLNQSLHVHG